MPKKRRKEPARATPPAKKLKREAATPAAKTQKGQTSGTPKAQPPRLPWGIEGATRVLFVGEGDFSFAACIARLLREGAAHSRKPVRRRAAADGGSSDDDSEQDEEEEEEEEEERVERNDERSRPPFARFVVATGLDTKEEACAKYGERAVHGHLTTLAECGCSNVYHGVDAANAIGPQLATKRRTAIAAYREAGLDDPDAVPAFDTVVFMFPHVGRGIKDEAANAQKNRELLFRFFRCAYGVLAWDRPAKHPRRVVVTLKQGAPYETLWRVKEVAALATESRLALHQVVPFDPRRFPGYAHRRTRGFIPGLSAPANEELSGGCKAYVFHAARAPPR